MSDIKTDTQAGAVTLPDPVDPTTESMNRLKPVVQSILGLVSSSHLDVGDNTKEQDDRYFPIAEHIIVLMRDGNVKYSEKETLFQLCLQPLDKLRTIVLGGLNKSFNRAFDLKMGKAFDQVTLVDLDEILKSEVIIAPAPTE